MLPKEWKPSQSLFFFFLILHAKVCLFIQQAFIGFLNAVLSFIGYGGEKSLVSVIWPDHLQRGENLGPYVINRV